MKNRAGLVLVGAAVAILGYALVYSGVSHLNRSITPNHTEVGVLESLTLSGGAAGGRQRRQPTRRPRKGPTTGPGGSPGSRAWLEGVR